jgi:hypothetical protein
MSEPELPGHASPGPSLPPPPFAPIGESGPAAAGPGSRSRRPVAIAAAVLALALVGGTATYFLMGSGPGASGPASGPATTLRLAFDRGDQTAYDIHMTMDGSVDAGPVGAQPLSMDMTETVGWKVLHVDESGTATVQISVTGVSGSINGMPVPAEAAQQSSTLRVTPDGQIVDAAGVSLGSTGGNPFGGFPGADQVTPILPEGSVAPGDSWDKRFSQGFPFGGGKIEFTAHSTFDRYERLGGVRAAVITTRYTVPLDFSIDLRELERAYGGAGQLGGLQGKDATIAYSGSGTFTQTSWLDLKAKQLLRSSSDGSFDMSMTFPPALAAQVGSDHMSMSATFSLDMTRR